MILFSLIAALIVILDQFSKILVLNYLKPISSITIIENILDFTYVENKGAAFGMLSNNRWIFMVASTIIIILLIAYILITKTKNIPVLISLGMIAGGGIGNMIDRICRTYVVDFIEVTFVKFYVFNIADSFVCIGCALLILFIIIEEVKANKAKKAIGNKNE